MQDKYATCEVLKKHNIPTIENTILFNHRINEGYNNAQVENIVLTSVGVVVKPNNGTQGKNVYHCKTKEEIESRIGEIFLLGCNVNVSPYYEIETEYRVFVLDGQVEIMYGKKKTEKDWKHNLSCGAKPINIENGELKAKLEQIAIRSGKSIKYSICIYRYYTNK